MKKLQIGIVFGGNSTEYNISLLSAKNIFKCINKNKFNILLIGIDKNNSWYLINKKNLFKHIKNKKKYPLKILGENIKIYPGKLHPFFLKNNITLYIDVIFPIMHGSPGENGAIQGFLEMIKIPYIGSDILSSSISMNKEISKKLIQYSGLRVAPFIILKKNQTEKLSFTQIIKKLGLPFFVKPTNQGSSIGVNKVINKKQFIQALSHAFYFNDKIIIEKAIFGKEIECAILGINSPKSSICGEIITKNKFYDYHTKYHNIKNVKFIIPANLSTQDSNKVKKTALKVFNILQCKTMARIDMFFTVKKEIIINEVNTLPGFTKYSMYPKLWNTLNVNNSNLISQLIQLTVNNYIKFRN